MLERTANPIPADHPGCLGSGFIIGIAELERLFEELFTELVERRTPGPERRTALAACVPIALGRRLLL